jgi:hypothetical protein
MGCRAHPAAPSPCRRPVAGLPCRRPRHRVCARIRRAVRTHPLTPDGRRRPGEMAVRTALSPRYLIRPPWPGAATRDENRACPAKLGSRCGRARWYTGDFPFRMRPEVQVLPGPLPAMTSETLVVGSGVSSTTLCRVKTLTWLRLVRRCVGLPMGEHLEGAALLLEVLGHDRHRSHRRPRDLAATGWSPSRRSRGWFRHPTRHQPCCRGLSWWRRAEASGGA